MNSRRVLTTDWVIKGIITAALLIIACAGWEYIHTGRLTAFTAGHIGAAMLLCMLAGVAFVINRKEAAIASQNASFAEQIAAINKSQAVIEFSMDGTIENANENFLSAVGYSLEEVKGKHHSMFVDSAHRSSTEYSEFWASLNRGQFQAAEYRRFGKGGREIWIQASYNPIMDENGKPVKVIKYATDITQAKMQNADYCGQIAAINKSQAVIEFSVDGIIQNANANFLNAVGYSLEEIKGQHHGMFVDSAYRSSAEYSEFWARLARGQYQAAEYRRFGKGGREIWIQASYNPIMDASGKPAKVVKYATDITQVVTTRMENERGMHEAVTVLKEVAGGNLTHKMEGEYQGTFTDIKEALNVTIGKLTDTLSQIRDSSGSVGNAASEISSGSADLSHRTEQQAASLEETAASMEELTSTVRQNSQNATEAAGTSLKASELANKGGDIVKRAVAAMNEIEKSSKKVSDIISVIDEIAFQTNLLALNAAVEAARAGDAGKGFAVVAAEVRSLAGRTADSSKEIKQLIVESGKLVQEGAVLVNQAGMSLEEIVTANNEVNCFIRDIASATTEQSSGIEEVNTAISQMDEMTQQNAALVEENTAACQSLVEQSRYLEKLVSFFQFDQEEKSASPLQAVPMERAASQSTVRSIPKLAAKRPVAGTRKAPAINGHNGSHYNGKVSAMAAADEWAEF